ncbi:nicastrin [Lichtheimia corymbifera JMRC:FSU:9682]|uniref:Nicastrin n=1 Tax=Lichtheimia corymbifera JMRC:FSU:9682 TaxID=1263082 RepID=A0A068S9M2_9FUNG|nr:nicastrin [Lichtheimia corymbifera JMRC:FSU:9682]
MRFHLLVIVIVALWTATFTLAEDIATKLYPYIYTNLNNWPCVRLLNATSTIGCHVPSTGSGVVYHIKSQDDLDSFVNGDIGTSDAYSIVLGYDLFTRQNIHALDSTGRVVGLVALLRGAMDQAQLANVKSPDSPCPNCQFGLYAQDEDAYVWNVDGQDLIGESFSIPIFGLNPTSQSSKQIYSYVMDMVRYNEERGYSHYPLQAMDFNIFMWAAVNSETCLRRGWCEPVGGLSVFASPSLNIQADDGKPVVVLAAAMDSRSMFHDLTIGTNTDVSGVVALLAVAEALSRVPTTNLSKHILYTLFAAEPWGFAGSQRFVQDISHPFSCTNASRAIKCPFSNAPCTNPCVRSLGFTKINMDNIDAIIEFNSVANANGSGYWGHVDDTTVSGPLVDSLVQSGNASIQPAYQDGTQRKLPPSSTMSFLAKKRDTRAVVITDYQKQLGSLYNSDVDDAAASNTSIQSICQLATATAKTIYADAQGNNTDAVAANCTLVASLMDCLVSNFSCPFMQNYFNVSGISRVSHYTSVFNVRNPQPQLIPRFAFTFLADVTGVDQQRSCQTIQDCDSDEYCVKQRCIKTFTAYHDAYGTGLQYDEGTGEIKVVDPTKGTWTESTWNAPMLRVFLVTSRKHQIVELVVGILCTIASMTAVLFGKRFFKKTFKID